jgi:hypothetical protein
VVLVAVAQDKSEQIPHRMLAVMVAMVFPFLLQVLQYLTLAAVVVGVLKQLSQTEVLVVLVVAAMGEVFQTLLALLELSILAGAVAVVVEMQQALTVLVVAQE